MKKHNLVKLIAFAVCITLISIFATACTGDTAPDAAQGAYTNGSRYIYLYEGTVDFVRVQGPSGDITRTGGTFEYNTSSGTFSVKFTSPTASYSGTINTSAKTITYNGLTYTKSSSRSSEDIDIEALEVEEYDFVIIEEGYIEQE